MYVQVPFEIEYETPRAVPISDVIDSLSALKTLIEEGTLNLPRFVPGLTVDEVRVNVRAITQQSPLREVFLVSLFLAFQKDLEREVPRMVEMLTETPVPEDFRTIVTVSILIAVFYGAGYVKDLISGASTSSAVSEQLTALVREIADMTGKREEDIRATLDERYKPKSRIKALAKAAISFFKPSKAQSNAPIRVEDRTLSSEVVADVPEGYAYEDVLEATTSKPFDRVTVEIHAQDRDRDPKWLGRYSSWCFRQTIADEVGRWRRAR